MSVKAVKMINIRLVPHFFIDGSPFHIFGAASAKA